MFPNVEIRRLRQKNIINTGSWIQNGVSFFTSPYLQVTEEAKTSPLPGITLILKNVP